MFKIIKSSVFQTSVIQASVVQILVALITSAFQLSSISLANAQSFGALARSPVQFGQENVRKSDTTDVLPNPDSGDTGNRDTWNVLREGFQLPELDSPFVDKYEKWLHTHPQFVDHVIARAQLYLPYILKQVRDRGLPTELALLPAIESAYDPFAVSRSDAVGMWQFIRTTAHTYGLRMDHWYDGRRDITASTHAALDYLQFLHDDFDGDWHKAIGAYNGGENRLHDEERRNSRHGKPVSFVHLNLEDETKEYLPKLIALARLFKDPLAYGIQLPQLPMSFAYRHVAVRGQIDLGLAAQLAGIDMLRFRVLNPAFKRRSTAPYGMQQILLPTVDASSLEHGLRQLERRHKLVWREHEVQAGENLAVLARANKVRLRDMNHANPTLRWHLNPGDRLRIPVSYRPFNSLLDNDVLARAQKTEDHDKLFLAPSILSADTPKARTHRVMAGDTLWKIAKKYSVKIHQLADWNGIRIDDVLLSGRKLLVSK